MTNNSGKLNKKSLINKNCVTINEGINGMNNNLGYFMHNGMPKSETIGGISNISNIHITTMSYADKKNSKKQ